MGEVDFMSFFNIIMPLSAAVTSLLIISIELLAERKHPPMCIRMLFLYFVCSVINWGSIFCYLYAPAVFVYINLLVMASFIMTQIFFYAFLFHLTRTNIDERFSRFHYLIPGIIFSIFVVLILITPYEQQYQTVVAKGHFDGGSLLFYYISNAKMPLRLIFSIVYTVLSFVRLFCYRTRIADYSANYEKSSLYWIKTYLFFSLSLILIPLLGVCMSRDSAISSPLLSIQIGLLMFQYAYLAFHVVKHNYVLFTEAPLHTECCLKNQNESIRNVIVQHRDEDESALKKTALTKQIFEDYLSSHRPFLNPCLKISDIAEDLNTNRTYLSSFINSEYNINFSRLINKYRHNEFNRLKENDLLKSKTDKDLAELVGFGSYKNFKRFVETDL